MTDNAGMIGAAREAAEKLKSIPEDVHQSAIDVVYGCGGNRVEIGVLASPFGLSLIARAILAERERCGFIAANRGKGDYLLDEFELGWSAACHQIRGDILGWERVMEEEE